MSLSEPFGYFVNEVFRYDSPQERVSRFPNGVVVTLYSRRHRLCPFSYREKVQWRSGGRTVPTDAPSRITESGCPGSVRTHTTRPSRCWRRVISSESPPTHPERVVSTGGKYRGDIARVSCLLGRYIAVSGSGQRHSVRHDTRGRWTVVNHLFHCVGRLAKGATAVTGAAICR